MTTFRSDNSGKYLNKEWIDYMKTYSVHWETMSPHMPEQNGAAECLNRLIMDHVQTVLIDVGASLFLWAEATNYVVYMCN